MTKVPDRLKFLTGSADTPGQTGNNIVQRIGIVDGAISGEGRLASLAALFPHVVIEEVGRGWPLATRCDVLIAPLDGAVPSQVDAVLQRLAEYDRPRQIIVILANADVLTTRGLIRGGAADVLPAPVSEAALAISLERLFAHDTAGLETPKPSGEVVAFIKAGGGVGATALATQLATLLGANGEQVGIADLDLQFGAAALYLDVPDALTVTDCLENIENVPLASALVAHSSGARVLAAPRHLAPLEMISPQQIETMLSALRRNFALTLLDLPPVWTSWTNQALHLSDRIVLVTQLTVPHIHLVKRQLAALSAQGLADRPLVLVCNGLSTDQQSSLSLKAAQRALDRDFDVVIPEDRRTMSAATNQGVSIPAVKRGTKLEKALVQLSEKVTGRATATSGKWGLW